jgi:hypothetical protein
VVVVGATVVVVVVVGATVVVVVVVVGATVVVVGATVVVVGAAVVVGDGAAVVVVVGSAVVGVWVVSTTSASVRGTATLPDRVTAAVVGGVSTGATELVRRLASTEPATLPDAVGGRTTPSFVADVSTGGGENAAKPTTARRRMMRTPARASGDRGRTSA